MKYVAYRPEDGQIVQVMCGGELSDAAQAAARLQCECLAVDDTTPVDDVSHYVLDGVLQAYSPAQLRARQERPTWPCRWSNTEMRWIDLRSLEQVKADCWAAIKAQRDAAEWGGFDTPFGRFDSDPVSQAKIIGAAQLASVSLAQGTPFTIEWTLQDNTSVSLDAAQMVAVGAALANHVNAVHQRGRQLRAQIEAAATIADLESITWTL